jgi:catechol 2,3-dioxygenase-like lactoylglutathione lyase family enzyme
MTDAIPPGGLPISQVACVVRDLDEALERYHRALGWGPWNIYEHAPPALHDTHYMGKPAEYSMLGAEVDTGSIVFELLQPLDGPSIYKDWLETHGEGLHHVAVMRHTADESDALKAYYAGLGAAPLMGGRIGETIEFFYLDTEPMLKIIVESGSGHAIDLKPVRQYP